MGIDFPIYVFVAIILATLAWLFWPTNDSETITHIQIPLTPIQDEKLVCPHCQVVGQVTTKNVDVKKGIDAAKAVAALITGGLSILATGLSQHDSATEATCSNCGSTWRF
jgi:hypothetical protein